MIQKNAEHFVPIRDSGRTTLDPRPKCDNWEIWTETISHIDFHKYLIIFEKAKAKNQQNYPKERPLNNIYRQHWTNDMIKGAKRNSSAT